jgi:hypothetical protein
MGKFLAPCGGDQKEEVCGLVAAGDQPADFFSSCELLSGSRVEKHARWIE